MKPSKKISADMHKLLIEKRMDGFSIVEAREASLSGKAMPNELGKYHQRIYRQIWQLEKKNWLRSEGYGKSKRYFKTAVFESFQFHLKTNNKRSYAAENINSNYSVLVYERNEAQGELEVVLGEIEEYRSLKNRFPELESRLTPFQEDATERSARLLSRVNVLTKVLKTLTEGAKEC
ncbi:hypothetical protein [Vibrio tapetis]|nr:hypothetical protein [Vibrio tapetis]